MNLLEFWTKEHRSGDDRWVSSSEPVNVLERLGVQLEGARSVLDVGPGRLRLANHLESLGKKVVLYDIATLDDPRYVDRLPLQDPVDLAIAHLVLQHVPTQDHHQLLLDVIESLNSGVRFYFDAVSENTGDNVALALEYAAGTSFPFTAWDLVTSKREVEPGYFFCVSQA